MTTDPLDDWELGFDLDPGWSLIVEDEAQIADLIELLVGRVSGLPVKVFLAGDEAIRHLADRSRPLVAICDVMLPGADGIEVARAIRRMDEGYRTRLIFVTAVAPARIEEHLKELKPYAFLRKPVRLSELQEIIFRAFDAAERSIELSAELSEELSDYRDSIDESAEITWD